MIELNTNTAIMLYLLITLTTLLGLWIYQHYSTRFKKVNVSDQVLHVCEYCHFAYLEGIETEITRCPQCKSFNKG